MTTRTAPRVPAPAATALVLLFCAAGLEVSAAAASAAAESSGPGEATARRFHVCGGGTVGAFDVHSAAPLWQTTLPSNASRGSCRLVQTANASNPILAVFSGQSFESCFVYALAPHDGKRLWDKELKDCMFPYNPMATADGGLVIALATHTAPWSGDSNFTIVALRAGDGQRLWATTWPAFAPGYHGGAPQFALDARGLLYTFVPLDQTESGGYIYHSNSQAKLTFGFAALDVKSGAVVWHTTNIQSDLTAFAPGTDLLHIQDGVRDRHCIFNTSSHQTRCVDFSKNMSQCSFSPGNAIGRPTGSAEGMAMRVFRDGTAGYVFFKTDDHGPACTQISLLAPEADRFEPLDVAAGTAIGLPSSVPNAVTAISLVSGGYWLDRSISGWMLSADAHGFHAERIWQLKGLPSIRNQILSLGLDDSGMRPMPDGSTLVFAAAATAAGNASTPGQLQDEPNAVAEATVGVQVARIALTNGSVLWQAQALAFEPPLPGSKVDVLTNPCPLPCSAQIQRDAGAI